MSIKGVQFTAKTYIVKNIVHDALLGLDFLIEQAAVINLGKKILELGQVPKSVRIQVPFPTSRKDDNSTITSIDHVPSIKKSSFDLICESDLMMEPFSTVRTRISSGVSGWSLQQKPYFTDQRGLHVYQEWREGDKVQIVIKIQPI